MRAATMFLTVLMLAAIAPEAARSQQWHVDLNAGRFQATLDPDATSESIALGLRYDDVVSGLRLSAGVPTGDQLWGAASGWRRVPLRIGSFVTGADLAANAFMTHQREQAVQRLPGPIGPPQPELDATGFAAAGQALALLGYEGVDLQVHARAGASMYRADFDDAAASRVVRMADVQVTYAPTAAMAVVPVARYFIDAGDTSATYLGVSAILSRSRLNVWGSAGRFVAGVGDDGAAASYAAGLQFRVQQRLSLQASARREGFDPLYLTPPQTAWSVGASLLVGGRAGPPPPPIPAAYEDGRATITLPASESATAPSIAGDFNDWSPQPMHRDGDSWSYTVQVEPGVYNYAFVNAAGEWFVPESVPGRKDDGMGGHVAVLVVE